MSRRRGRALRLVVTGPYGAGKTTLISSISDTPVLATEQSVTAPDGGPKRSTTVAMDFGRLRIDDELVLHLYGTPGQRRFDFMWRILADGMLGFVVVVDAGDAPRLAEARQMLRYFGEDPHIPAVVAVNKGTREPAELDRVAADLAVPERVGVVACDARDRESVKGTLVALLDAVLQRLPPSGEATVGV